jgi:hypothetical protein
MRTCLIPRALGALALGMLALATARTASADEFESRTPYYEDDAWYDVSEWLDGNDYNPTDEAIGRWDDETYHAATSADDSDNDSNGGYAQDQESKDNDWYYDNSDNRQSSYYSSQNRDDVYAYRWDYFDYDRDGYYDAMTSFHDSDNDGSYDQLEYYAFSDSGTGGGQQGQQAQGAGADQGSSKSTKLTGTVKTIKKMNVRGDALRWVAQVATDDGKTLMVDFGPVDELKGKLTEGQKVTVHGPLAKTGKHQVVLAQSVSFGDQGEQQINRSGRKLSGTIAKVHRATVRGEEHQMALLKLDSGKQALIDLGSAESLGVNLSEGDQVDVRGVPVKVKDRLVIIANSVTKSGEKTRIERVAAKDRAPASS